MGNEKKRRSVLFLQYPWRLWRTRLAGIYRYAAKVGWNVQISESDLTSMPIKREPAFCRPVGCIDEAIMTTRIQRVKELLLNRGIPIDSIFCECG